MPADRSDTAERCRQRAKIIKATQSRKNPMKPDATTAMQQLIGQIRTSFPFDRPEAQICNGPCDGCSMKLLNYLESELDSWENRIAAGERPGLAELSRLIRTSRKIGRVLEKAELMQMPEEPGDR